MVFDHAKRIRSTALFLGLMGSAGLAAGNACAQTLVTVSSAGANDHGTALMLSQRIDRRVPRDQVQVELRIDMIGADSKQLQTQVQTLLDSAIQKAKAVPKIAIETGAYTVLREADPHAPRSVQGAMLMAGNGSAVPLTVSSAGDWHAIQLLSLTTTDFAGMAPLVSDLENNGMQLSDMRVSLTPDAMREVENELAPQAIAALRTQAEKLAAAMDMKIDRFANLSVTNSPPEIQPQPRPAINFNQQTPQTVIMPSGDFDVWVAVNANLQLVPKAAP
ncbi:MAG TPA: SIMPL domain-containing protein [Stellaceae bacterium]|jgi:predicted secreted protein